MSPVLNYFGFPGRGEATRVALAVAGVSYEDKRLSPAEFGVSSFMAVPVYQMGGNDYTQSTALLRYAGKLGGMYPEDPLEALQVDEIVMMLEDVFLNLLPILSESDENKKTEMCKTLITGKAKRLLENVASRKAKNSSSPFFVGDSLTIADIQLHAVVATVQTGYLFPIPKTMVGDICPNLQDIDNAVMEHPKVKAYYASKV